ncbi:MAG: hypothetical protein K9N09_07005 [Candidatus Cloacimonetes bacterium]|nr:hypothetical protein [Candidatus Cloacimonadota bacterium]MCF7814972.1 hypothetical protein [Candidatus Cloacimonadota bacterium]MCF7868433.1 hypothetical protein [Candidatus Cloacimonadota bacterium]MCF7883906.1 hypothetical protein [Candidatus Cloacimonadota bacterium]
MNTLNPVEIINKIQTAKYKKIALPILLVITSFIINHFYQFEETRYIAIVGLIWYVFIFMQFKVNRVGNVEEDTICSPLSGKITDVSKQQIIITKSWFDSSDIRFSGLDENILFWAKKPVILEDSDISGKLIGYTIGRNSCKIEFDEEWETLVEIGQKVISGDPILKKRENDGE